jgi:hypothetical protein
MRPVSAIECATWLESLLDEESSGERILARAVMQTMDAPTELPPRIDPTEQIDVGEADEV